MQSVTHNDIVQLHRDIAGQHVDINGFFRFNFNELTGNLRSGVATPALALESPSSVFQSNGVSTFHGRDISFILIDFTGKADAYDKQNEVLDNLEVIAKEIGAYLATKNRERGHWLYGLFDINSFRMEKVGPVFDNMYGWNVLYTLKNQETTNMNPSKWVIPSP